MSNVLFVAAAASEGSAMLEEKPIVRGNIQIIAASHIRLNETKENLIRSNQWLLTDEDVVAEACSVLCEWTLNMPVAPVIFAFDALCLIRRLAGVAAHYHQRFLPAAWWCGTGSRVLDIRRYLSADSVTTLVDLLQNAGINCHENYVPHIDPRLDLKYLIELADKYHIINLQLSEGLNDVLPALIRPPVAVVPVREIKKVNVKKKGSKHG
jgi:hypothetical protein